MDKLTEERSKLYTVRKKYISEIAEKLPKGNANVEITLDVEEQGARKKFIEMLNINLKGIPKHWRDAKYPERIAGYYTPIEFASAIKSVDVESFVSAGFQTDEGVEIISHLRDNPKEILKMESGCGTLMSL